MRTEELPPRSDNPDEYSSILHQRTEELYRIPDAEQDTDGCFELPFSS